MQKLAISIMFIVFLIYLYHSKFRRTTGNKQTIYQC